VDYDGSRSDYAATDTYGRNAVWSDYIFTHHMEGNSNNATGGSNPTATNNITFSTSNGKLTQGAGFGGSNSDIRQASASTPSTFTTSYWVMARNKDAILFNKDGVSTNRCIGHYYSRSTKEIYFFAFNTSSSSYDAKQTSIDEDTWYLFHTVWSGGNYRSYKNGGNEVTNTSVGTIRSANEPIWFGARSWSGSPLPLNGEMDEVRFTSEARSANWITTEYNNQDDESSFWPTWTDAGGAPVANNGFALWWA
jgi:hypothetical protein